MSEELTIINRTAHIIKRNRAALSFPDDNAVINNVANNLVRRLRELKIDFSSVLLIGYNELVANLLRKLLHVKLIIQSDIAEQMIRKAIKDDHLKEKKSLKIVADEEYLPFPEKSFDVVINFLTLHWINDLPGFLLQIKKSLKPNGFFCSSFFGGETLIELRKSITEAENKIENSITKRVPPFINIQQAGALLQRAGFTSPVIAVSYTHLTLPTILLV